MKDIFKLITGSQERLVYICGLPQEANVGLFDLGVSKGETGREFELQKDRFMSSKFKAYENRISQILNGNRV